MPYRIEIERRAGKGLRKLPRQAQSRIATAVDALTNDPRPPGCLAVQNAPKGTYRVRVDDYRVIYVVKDEDQVIIIARITRRGESTYKGL